jgi:hypothetical protein
LSANHQSLFANARKTSLVYPISVVLVMAALFGLVFFRKPLTSDASAYYKMSLKLLKGEPSDFYWPLGWPVMMVGAESVLGISQYSVKAFTFLLALTTLVIQMITVKKVLSEFSSSTRYLIGIGTILVNAPHILYNANFTYTVVPMAFWGALLIYVLLFMRSSSFFTGLIISIMTTIRFGSIFLLPFILIYKSLQKDSLRSLVLTTVVVFILISIPIAFVSFSLDRFTLLNTSNVRNLLYGNHPYAPLYETWQWGTRDTPQKKAALKELGEKYAIKDTGRMNDAMRTEVIAMILKDPGKFLIRCLTRLSVLLAFDSSVGADELRLGNRLSGLLLIGLMLAISLITKSAAIIGVVASRWPGRHLVWTFLCGLSIPHILAFAHPSYFQMFMNVTISAIALAVAQVDPKLLRSSAKLIVWLVAILLFCHAILIYYMITTRF